MTIAHKLQDWMLDDLQSHPGPQLLVAQAGSFRQTDRGSEAIGLVAGLRALTIDYVLFHANTVATESGPYPGLAVQKTADYQGDWVSDVELLHLPPMLDSDVMVESMAIVRDDVEWRWRLSDIGVHVTSDVGLLVGLSNKTDFLVAALDSLTSLIQFNHLFSQEQLSWWLSEEGIRYTWTFDDSPEGQEVLYARRTVAPIF